MVKQFRSMTYPYVAWISVMIALPMLLIVLYAFTVSGNGPHASLKEDLEAAGTNRDHYVVNIHVEDHQDFIAAMYEGAQDLGDA